MKTDMVLESYRQGDADKRLSLFLYYRELRDAFTCIEQDDFSDLFAGSRNPEPAKESMLQRFLVLFRNRSRASDGRAAS